MEKIWGAGGEPVDKSDLWHGASALLAYSLANWVTLSR